MHNEETSIVTPLCGNNTKNFNFDPFAVSVLGRLKAQKTIQETDYWD